MKKMNVTKNVILSGSLVAGAFFGISNLLASPSAGYCRIGSGSEIRSELIGSNSSAANALELSCGSKTKTDSTKMKTKDGKCGEGKCGNSKMAKSDTTKMKDAKCGNKK